MLWPKLTCAEGARAIFFFAQRPKEKCAQSLVGGGASEGGVGGVRPPPPPHPPAGDGGLFSKTLGVIWRTPPPPKAKPPTHPKPKKTFPLSQHEILKAEPQQ